MTQETATQQNFFGAHFQISSKSKNTQLCIYPEKFCQRLNLGNDKTFHLHLCFFFHMMMPPLMTLGMAVGVDGDVGAEQCTQVNYKIS